MIHTVKWKKSHDQPKQHIKSRDITLLTNVNLVKAMVFPVVMYGCGSWTITDLYPLYMESKKKKKIQMNLQNTKRCTDLLLLGRRIRGKYS